MGLRRSLGVVLVVTMAAAFPAVAQTFKPPVAALTAARTGQDYAPTKERVIHFYNEEAVTTTFVQAPAVGSTSGPASTDVTNWLKVEFHYSVNPEDPQKYPWVDAVQFKVWIEGRDLYAANAPAGSQNGVAVCLTGSVTYVNLHQAKDAYGVFYVDPSVLARYCGNGNYEDFDRKFDVHVEADIGGKEIDWINKNHETDDSWYTKPTPVPNLVMRMNQSPFSRADVSHYPMIKLPTESGSSQ
jgi:hypothetical protein